MAIYFAKLVGFRLRGRLYDVRDQAPLLRKLQRPKKPRRVKRRYRNANSGSQLLVVTFRSVARTGCRKFDIHDAFSAHRTGVNHRRQKPGLPRNQIHAFHDNVLSSEYVVGGIV